MTTKPTPTVRALLKEAEEAIEAADTELDKLMLRVLLVTPWDTPCGIAEHSWYLKQAVEAADPEIQIVPCPQYLDPRSMEEVRSPLMDGADRIVHLNYQASLHSRWTPKEILRLRRWNWKVLVTFHDTGVPNSGLCKAICEAADAVVVHEPFDDLPAEKVRYWRMGVPGSGGPWQFGRVSSSDPSRDQFKAFSAQPVLGSIGFPFGWKNYDQLAKITGEIGWALLLLAPNATTEQAIKWRTLNPNHYLRIDFVPRHEALSLLSGCDATAFTYVCHNTGQSGAILQGIAARKPVIALHTCRQMRALYLDPLGLETIRWCETFEEVAFALRTVSIERCDPGIVALAKQDSWQHLGEKYAALYRELADA